MWRLEPGPSRSRLSVKAIRNPPIVAQRMRASRAGPLFLAAPASPLPGLDRIKTPSFASPCRYILPLRVRLKRFRRRIS
jgi:hypothetical protein